MTTAINPNKSNSKGSVFYHVYASSASVPFDSAALLELLKKGRRNNEAVNVTGMLLFKGGNFLQALEGEEQAVRATMERISQDPRHRGVMKLLEGRTDTRQFAEWSMAFRDLESPEARATPGYSEFLNESLLPSELAANPGRCQKLLDAFRKSFR
jgi:hypothetical protein